MMHILVFGLTVLALASGSPALCQTVPGAYAQFPQGVRSYGPQQTAQPVARSVNVTVPVPQPPKQCGPPACVPPPPYCSPVFPTAAASRPMPVRVDIAVRPETCDQRHPVPVVYRDPGFFGPIIRHSVGLVGATVAAPFRVLEMLCPLEGPPCPANRPCSPPACAMIPYHPPAAPPLFVPKCPAPPCPPVLTCAPPGPSVAPLPPCASPPPCGPFLPPALVDHDEELPCAPQSLLGGFVQLPFTLAERGRFMGDMGRPSPWASGCYR